MVKIHGSLFLGLALGLLIFPLRWGAGVLFAAAVHELGHLGAIRLWGGRVEEMELSLTGAVIRTGSVRGEHFCILAGPLAGALVMLLWPWWPEAAVAAGCQTVYNLLPIYPLDGGRLVRNICCKRKGFGV